MLYILNQGLRFDKNPLNQAGNSAESSEVLSILNFYILETFGADMKEFFREAVKPEKPESVTISSYIILKKQISF